MPSNISDKFLTENVTGSSLPAFESKDKIKNRIEREAVRNEREMEKEMEEFVREQKKLDPDEFTKEDRKKAEEDFFKQKSEEEDKNTFISVAEHKKALEDLKLQIISELEGQFRLVPFRKDAVKGKVISLNDNRKPSWDWVRSHAPEALR